MSRSALPLVAVDCTLVGGENTGDSTYWTGLVRAMLVKDPGLRLLLLSNLQKPDCLPETPEWARWVRLGGRQNRYFNQVRMPLAARRLGARAFHTQYTLSPLAPGGITTIHDVSFLLGPEWFRPRDRFLLSHLVPGSARRARRVITVSETSKRDIVRLLGVPEDKVVVTWNGVDERYKPVPREDALARLGRYDVEPPYVLTVGTRWPRKNIALAIEAAGRLPAGVPHRLVVTGKPGWGMEEWESGSRARVQFTGYIDDEDMPALYSAADLYLCPSHYEGFGLPVVEAMACGTPVLSSAGGALPEVIGDAGVIEERLDPAIWAARIASLLQDSSMLAGMRERGLQRAKQFTWEAAAGRTLEVYREVCAGA